MSMPETDNRPGVTRWRKIYERDGHHCIYCGDDLFADLRTYHSATEDHLYPRSPKGKPAGSDGQCNLVPACQVCNSLKADFIPDVDDSFFRETAKGLKFVTTDDAKRAIYINLVWAEIQKRRTERENELTYDRIRVGWNASSKTL